MSTSILVEMVPKLRRAIGDTEEPYGYSDNILVEYIEDAVDSIRIFWKHDYSVNRINHTINLDVEDSHQILFVMESKLSILERASDISFRTGTLSVTRKSDDKKRLENKIKEAVNILRMFDGIMSSSTEFDDYVRSLEDWLYIKSL